MNIHFAPERPERRVKIKVIGVGGAGGNAVNRMIEEGLADVDFYAINTDSQALEASRAHQTLVIGNQLTRGLGAGGDPEIGRQAAEEDRETLAALVQDTDMVFVTAGMGGGTGTGAAPLVAAAARQSGALTVAVVTRPFLFEGRRRLEQAEVGLAALREHVDALLVIPNERLMEIEVADGGMTSVFKLADSVLYEATRGISDIIAQHAVVNLDFADVRTVMQDSGAAIMGTGRASGMGRAQLAAEQAIRSPLLEDVDIHGSRAVLVYLSAASVDREDLREAMGYIQTAAGNDAHIFFGFANAENLGEDLLVTVIATGFPGSEAAGAAGIGHWTVGAAVKPAASEVPVVQETQAVEDVKEEQEVPEVPEVPELSDVMEAAPSEPDVEVGGVDPVEAEVVAEQAAPVDSEAAMAAMDQVQADPAAAVMATPPSPPQEPGTRPRQESDQPQEPGAPRREAWAFGGQPEGAVDPTPGLDVQSEDCDTKCCDNGSYVDFSDEDHAVLDEADPAEVAVAEVPINPPPTQLAALAAAAGGQGRVLQVGAQGSPSGTSRRFLEPLGTVQLAGQPPQVRPVAQRFRSTVLDDDKLRPAWERKYVD